MTVIVDGTNGVSLVASAAVPQAGLQAGVAGNGPCFSAYQSTGQTLAANTFTKLQFQTKIFDTASSFDATTNYRFTPGVPGYYQINTALAPNASTCGIAVALYKNGTMYQLVTNNVSVVANTGQGSCLVYLNGSTDYIEIYGLFTTGQSAQALQQSTWVNGFLARSA